jgi:CRP/FNR family transcriptional regulator, cyclic AMP receptor protein
MSKTLHNLTNNTDGDAQKRKLLESSSLFKGFDADLLNSIVPLLKECSYEADNVICLKGDVSDGLYIIREGQVEISVSSQEGKVIILGTLTDGDVFGEIALLDQSTRTANVVAKTDVTMYQLKPQDFTRVAQKFGQKEWMAITGYICALFRSVTNNLEEAMFLDTSLRVAKTLLKIAGKSGKPKIEISQEDLGKMVGLSREATNKALATLADRDLIERGYKGVVIPDMARFTAYVAEKEV